MALQISRSPTPPTSDPTTSVAPGIASPAPHSGAARTGAPGVEESTGRARAARRLLGGCEPAPPADQPRGPSVPSGPLARSALEALLSINGTVFDRHDFNGCDLDSLPPIDVLAARVEDESQPDAARLQALAQVATFNLYFALTMYQQLCQGDGMDEGQLAAELHSAFKGMLDAPISGGDKVVAETVASILRHHRAQMSPEMVAAYESEMAAVFGATSAAPTLEGASISIFDLTSAPAVEELALTALDEGQPLAERHEALAQWTSINMRAVLSFYAPAVAQGEVDGDLLRHELRDAFEGMAEIPVPGGKVVVADTLQAILDTHGPALPPALVSAFSSELEAVFGPPLPAGGQTISATSFNGYDLGGFSSMEALGQIAEDESRPLAERHEALRQVVTFNIFQILELGAQISQLGEAEVEFFAFRLADAFGDLARAPVAGGKEVVRQTLASILGLHGAAMDPTLRGHYSEQLAQVFGTAPATP